MLFIFYIFKELVVKWVYYGVYCGIYYIGSYWGICGSGFHFQTKGGEGIFEGHEEGLGVFVEESASTEV